MLLWMVHLYERTFLFHDSEKDRENISENKIKFSKQF